MGLLGRLLTVGPHAGAHRVALRASVSVVVPLLALWATGHLPWSIYAVFGAFASLYGRERTDRARLTLQVEAGKFNYRLVRAELTFDEPGTVEARCSLDRTEPVIVPLTLLPTPAA